MREVGFCGRWPFDGSEGGVGGVERVADEVVDGLVLDGPRQLIARTAG